MSVALVNPGTGELVALDQSTDVLAGWLADVREHESRLREAKQIVADEITRRFDRNRCWTERTGDLKITGQSDAEQPVYDTEGLMEALDVMVAEGLIAPDAVSRAVQATVTYRVRAAGMNALLKNPALRERLTPFITMVAPAVRRVSVSRA